MRLQITSRYSEEDFTQLRPFQERTVDVPAARELVMPMGKDASR
jgi:hypothetical protein